NAVVSGLERHVQVPADGRSLAESGDQLAVDMVHLDRRQAQAREPLDGSGLADEPRQRAASLPVAVAAEVDSRQHDLAVTLCDPLLDLTQDSAQRPATRAAAHERNDTEVAGEAAAVLDLHERPDPVEPRVGSDACD